MARGDKEVRLIPGSQDGSAHSAVEPPDDLNNDVRSTVESQFRQMEQAHERIRAEELAARLGEHKII